MREQSTSEVVQEFSAFCTELRQKQAEGVPGFEGDSIAQMVGLQAQKLADEFEYDGAFSLLMTAAKFTMMARISIEQGMDETEALQKLGVALKEVAKHLDE
jgi:hypothetical protein